MAKLVVFLTVFFSALATAMDRPSIVGEAYSLDNQELLYREFHYLSGDGLDHKVIYRSGDNEELAVKTIDYRSGLNTPTFRQQNISSGEMIDIRSGEDQLLISYLKPGSDSPVEASVEKPAQLVIDAGFNHFIQQQWVALSNDNSVEFKFPAPTRQTLVGLMVERAPCRQSPSAMKDSELVCFSIQSSSWLFRLLLDPIELSYDKTTQRLLRYRGLGNVPAANGETYRVDIRYQYTQSAAPQLAQFERLN